VKCNTIKRSTLLTDSSAKVVCVWQEEAPGLLETQSRELLKLLKKPPCIITVLNEVQGVGLAGHVVRIGRRKCMQVSGGKARKKPTRKT
jgi:hypothetical protein